VTAPLAPLRLGTRRSLLARRQSAEVAERLQRLLARRVELVDVTTQGDVDGSPLASIGGTGVFVSALREALLEGYIDLAVHSLKDLPTAQAEGLVLAAVPTRADPRDVLCSRGRRLRDLPAGSRVGTGSPRRAAALRALGLGLEPVAIRGNVDTRLAMVTDGTCDAVVLAHAGLSRLGRIEAMTQVLEPSEVLPAPGQGALAVEVGADLAPSLREAIAGIDDPGSRAAVMAERSLLAALEAGCSAPVGALATPVTGGLHLQARVWAPDGTRTLAAAATGSLEAPNELGWTVATALLDDGAADLMPVPVKERTP